MDHDEAVLAKLKATERRVHERDDDIIIVAPEHPYFTRHMPEKYRPRVVEIHDLIARADEYVTIADNGDAVIAKAIEKAMSRAEVEHVETLVSIHNMKLHERYPFQIKPVDDSESTTDTSNTGTTSQPLGDPPPTPCTPHVTFTAHWWGFRIYMDHCMCNALKLGTYVSGVASVVTALLAAAGLSIANPYIALAVGLISLMLGWIAWADGYCIPNSGANYNQSWTVQGWITTVC